MSLSFEALRDRFAADRARQTEGRHDATAARLELALDAIGWRSAGGSSSQEVAAIAAHIVENCVAGHHDLAVAVTQLAELLHNSAATLDGSMSSPSMYVPAADEVLSRYVR
ncbi:MAG: hypothetical protein ABIT20_00855 [Gemmatimonadaceae bacterium]